ncbi:MAG TPA: hypothetical protein VES93_09985 [Ornithinibacter sp.]|nr:hypothetical protein [Ornithinibacter sp.]
MSFDDLPENWSDLPLDTPGLAADVADLVVGHRDRLGGCVGLVLTRADLTMSQPAVINDVDDTVEPEELRPFLVQLCRMVAETGGALLFVRGREGSVLLTDSDRRWHQMATDACRAGGVALVGAFLATPAVVRAFPEPLESDPVDDLAS